MGTNVWVAWEWEWEGMRNLRAIPAHLHCKPVDNQRNFYSMTESEVDRLPYLLSHVLFVMWLAFQQ